MDSAQMKFSAKPLYASRTFLDTAIQNQLAYFPWDLISVYIPSCNFFIPKNKWAEKGIIKK